MIKLDKYERKFFEGCRFLEVDGKILVKSIGFLDVDKSAGLGNALKHKFVYVEADSLGNVWMDKDLFYENKNDFYGSRRRPVRSCTDGMTDDQVAGKIKSLSEEYGAPIDAVIGLYYMMPNELYDGIPVALEDEFESLI